MASTTPPWTRSAAMPTRFMTASPMRSRCSMPSMWCGSGLRWSMRSGVGCSKTAWAAGHKHDPLYQIRGLLRHGVEHLTERQQAKLNHCLDAGDPIGEVDLAWQCYQQLRSIYHAVPAKGREIAIKVLDSFHTCPIPEVARLGRTLRSWRAQILAYFDTHGVSNGGTEAINLIIEKVRRLAHGFKDFDHYRLRILLAADGSRRYRNSQNHP